MIFRFGEFQLDTWLLELLRDETPVPIEPRVFDVLRLLIENRDRLVGKDELIETVWGGRIVSEVTLSSCMNSVRRAVGDDGKRQEIIRTLPRRGFRFVQPVAIMDEAPSSSVEGDPNFRDAGIQFDEDGSTPALPDKPSIAVLPFRNLSGDPDQEYFSDGISEDLTTELSRNPWLFVITQSSGFVYKGNAVDVKRVGRELGVRYVVEGSVRRSDGRIRVATRLIDAANGRQLWAERYDRPTGELFDLQDKITEAIAGTLVPALDSAERERVLRKPPQASMPGRPTSEGYGTTIAPMKRMTRPRRGGCSNARSSLIPALPIHTPSWR